MAHDKQHFDISSELWFKTTAFVLADSIHSVCCSTAGGDLSWDINAFGTLRLVSKSFNHTAIKVADLALTGIPDIDGVDGVDGVAPVSEEEGEPVGGDSEGNGELDKLKLIYDRFKLFNGIQSEHARTFVSQSGVPLISAYYDYVQLIKSSKAIFWRSNIFTVTTTNRATLLHSQKQLELMEMLRVRFPTTFSNICSVLDNIAVPEMVERLRRDVRRDWKFIAGGLEIVYRCAQVVNRRDEWQSSDVSTKFIDHLNDLHAVMKISTEFYASGLKDRAPGEFPAIAELLGVRAAIELIVGNGHYHQALEGLVNS